MRARTPLGFPALTDHAPSGAADGDRDWNGLIVIDSANPWDGVKLADHHLAEHLTAHAPVLFVDPPVSHLTPRRHPERAAALQRPRLHRLGPRLARLVPIAPPGPRRPGIVHVTTKLVRAQLRHALAAMGHPRVDALLATSSLVSLADAACERLTIYWAQDDFVGGAGLMGVDADRVGRGELRLARASDLIVAANPLVAESWRARGFATTKLIPFGVDAAAFARVDDTDPANDVHLPAPIAGLVGHLNARLELPYLEAIADQGTSLLLVGPRAPDYEPARMDALLARPNVQWVGPKPFNELPRYLRCIDVGLVPYDIEHPFNIGSFPLKTLEYLAAGRAVVSTDLPATRWFATDLIDVVDRGVSPSVFAALVSERLSAERTPTLVEARQAFATRHSWANRASQWNELIASAH